MEDRSIASMSSSSAWIDGSVGPLNPYPTPTVESTIGMSNAFAVLARRRTLSSTRSALVSDRMTSNILLVVDQHHGAVVSGPDAEIPRRRLLLSCVRHPDRTIAPPPVSGRHRIPV